MICNDYLRLIPGFLDGELSEAQAAPLRRHLMDCPGCRNSAAGEKAFKRWFDFEEPPVEVPDGFAARVARRAFDGDTGERPEVARIAEREIPILQFVLRVTAVAAGLLLVMAGWLRSVQLPDGDASAGGRYKTPDEIVRILQEKRQQEAAQPTAEDPADAAREADREEADREEGDER